MDETIYGKCGYLSVKWEFRNFSQKNNIPGTKIYEILTGIFPKFKKRYRPGRPIILNQLLFFYLFFIISTARSLSLYFWIFPLAVRGYSSTMKMCLGTLYRAILLIA